MLLVGTRKGEEGNVYYGGGGSARFRRTRATVPRSPTRPMHTRTPSIDSATTLKRRFIFYPNLPVSILKESCLTEVAK